MVARDQLFWGLSIAARDPIHCLPIAVRRSPQTASGIKNTGFTEAWQLHAETEEFTALQRLFSMFPNGWPGVALLLLRVAASILLILDGAIALQLRADLRTTIVQSVALGAGTLLLLGLWTPIAGVLVTLVEVCVVLLGTAHVRSSILLGAVGAALVALGPGSTSIDARLFGRKRLDIPEP
jgi:putative oxidoreductase